MRIALGHCTTARHDLGQPLELLTPYRRLNVRQAEVEPEHFVGLENHFPRAVPHRVGYRHAVLAPQAKLIIPVTPLARDQTPVAHCQQLAWVEREAGRIAMRPA